LPPGLEFFGDFARVWRERGQDVIFRGAPHFIVASAPVGALVGAPDCLIALSYFELFAHSLGVGTVWDGMAKWAINDILPQMKGRLGIPDDHAIGYAMAFGWPAVKYQRGVKRAPHKVILVK
ncbi:nitroreductase, partial [bacterium]